MTATYAAAARHPQQCRRAEVRGDAATDNSPPRRTTGATGQVAQRKTDTQIDILQTRHPHLSSACRSGLSVLSRVCCRLATMHETRLVVRRSRATRLAVRHFFVCSVRNALSTRGRRAPRAQIGKPAMRATGFKGQPQGAARTMRATCVTGKRDGPDFRGSGRGQSGPISLFD